MGCPTNSFFLFRLINKDRAVKMDQAIKRTRKKWSYVFGLVHWTYILHGLDHRD